MQAVQPFGDCVAIACASSAKIWRPLGAGPGNALDLAHVGTVAAVQWNHNNKVCRWLHSSDAKRHVSIIMASLLAQGHSLLLPCSWQVTGSL